MTEDLRTLAIREAYASRTSDTILQTIELRHPAFVNGQGATIALRFVLNGEDVALLLEDDAVMNAGETVMFTAMPFGLEPPSSSEGQVPQVRFWIDNVSSQIHPHLQAAVRIRAPIVATWREYIVGLDGPQQRVDGIELRNVKVTNARATAIAKLNDWQDRLFPGKVYTRDEFRTLS
ncbi:DUF1833 family protein [Stappia sp. F7233]|uniref:DUF1833 family protein n=1 Tax=Stappia albiluteola TaxID=2758565 RepID=A0A839AKJ6_9HYPH|nr:DUF1833 family protein [Stappia albiluteola]MBA5779534.1 DUF1833 family protein [Stappia albiluteola]